MIHAYGVTFAEHIKKGGIMKTTAVLLFLMTGLLCNQAACATSVYAGSPLELTFSNLPCFCVGTSPNYGAIVDIRPSSSDPLDLGDVVRLELFNDTAFTSPVPFGEVFDFNGPAVRFGVSVGNAFQDNQGGIRLTALSGSVDIESLRVDIYIDGHLYFRDLITTTPIPEPESLSHMLAGLALVGFAAKRRRKAWVAV